VFVGTAKPADVDTYLRGAPYDVVVDLTAGQKATTRKVPGSQQPQPPGSQRFWVAQTSGAPAVLTAHVASGDSLVLMNSDATPVVDADVVVTLTVAKAWTYSWLAVGLGVLLVLLAVLLFWRARVAGRRRREAAPAQAQDEAAVATAAATVLPGSAADALPLAGPPTAVLAAPVSVAPVDQDVVASPPSPELAALVADAAPVDDTVVMPVVAPESDAGADAPPLAARGPAAPTVESGAAVVTTDDADPLFDELVAAHGADPVHDELQPAMVEAVDATVPTAADDVSSSTPTTDG
jgi:hypothetical protein